jgi:hypothetical protein
MSSIEVGKPSSSILQEVSNESSILKWASQAAPLEQLLLISKLDL